MRRRCGAGGAPSGPTAYRSTSSTGCSSGFRNGSSSPSPVGTFHGALAVLSYFSMSNAGHGASGSSCRRFSTLPSLLRNSGTSLLGNTPGPPSIHHSAGSKPLSGWSSGTSSVSSSTMLRPGPNMPSVSRRSSFCSSVSRVSSSSIALSYSGLSSGMGGRRPSATPSTLSRSCTQSSLTPTSPLYTCGIRLGFCARAFFFFALRSCCLMPYSPLMISRRSFSRSSRSFAASFSAASRCSSGSRKTSAYSFSWIPFSPFSFRSSNTIRRSNITLLRHSDTSSLLSQSPSNSAGVRLSSMDS
mmetsp:Transcript_24201/g.82655  ORF Transcript_24201/g.82655 Transcript_24201/m.82655 type:complete len:300 (-) Transcript_24201:1499-2398(-)